MLKYESGAATKNVASIPGKHDEVWLNALDLNEPAAPPTLQRILTWPATSPAVRGRVIDVAAGCCWATARLSNMDSVTEVVALDLSESFLTTVGDRIIRRLGANLEKIRFAVSTFESIPFQDSYFDCAFLIATFHHIDAPVRVLTEIHRVLRPGGSLFIFQAVSSALRIRVARRQAIQSTRASAFTDIAYTRDELTYLLKHCGFSKVQSYPMDVLIKRGYKRFVRRILRQFDVEHLLLNTMYGIHAEVAT
jgi:ubiquinone/menaquinone biosynthesis C-methylase UbiE